MINKNLYPYIVATIIVCTTFLFISNKIETSIFFKIIEVFFSVYILSAIGIGFYKVNKYNKNIVLTLLANGLVIYTIYVIKLINESITLNLKEYLTLIVSFISMILLCKIYLQKKELHNINLLKKKQ